MRRADRLFQIIQILRSGRIMTARRLAETLEVSERTVYRDIGDLMASGVPIEGEAGIGYVLRRGFDLPPLMFNTEEIAALALGARLVQSWADPQLARAAQQVLSKVETVLPAGLREKLVQTNLFAPLTQIPPDVAAAMASLRPAIDNRNKVSFDYTREDQTRSARTVWPLGLFFWGSVWILGGWCELREAFRHFRLDRMKAITPQDDVFPQLPGRTLDDLVREARGK